MNYTKITKTERELLSQWKQEGLSNKDCTKRLNRHVSTIGRELTRNKTRVRVGKNDWDKIYEPAHAQHIAMQRKQKAWDAKHIKEQENILLCA